MIRKNHIEVLKDGRWHPVKKRLDYYRLSIVVIVLAVIGSCLIYRNRIENLIMRRNINDSRTVSGDESRERDASGKRLLGEIVVNDESLIIDSSGKVYRESDGKLQLLKSSVVKLSTDEKIAGIIASPQGYILGINNKEGEPFIKFLRITENGVTEEKILYKSSLRENDLNQNAFVTLSGDIIARTDDGQYVRLNLPVNVNDISDYGIYRHNILICDKMSGIYLLDLGNITDSESNWIRVRKRDSGVPNKTNRNQILKAFDEQLYVIAGNNFEHWRIKDQHPSLEESISLEKVLDRLPSSLADFKTLNLSASELINDRCLANTSIIYCPNLNPQSRAFIFLKKQIIASDSSRYSVTPLQ